MNIELGDGLVLAVLAMAGMQVIFWYLVTKPALEGLDMRFRGIRGASAKSEKQKLKAEALGVLSQRILALKQADNLNMKSASDAAFQTGLEYPSAALELMGEAVKFYRAFEKELAGATGEDTGNSATFAGGDDEDGT